MTTSADDDGLTVLVRVVNEETDQLRAVLELVTREENERFLAAVDNIYREAQPATRQTP